ncbi:hypothetical protein N9O69_03125 [Alphaproteobacteria bacterium]|nr:hypothetical protein [Alphaproteobacteria bacterium]
MTYLFFIFYAGSYVATTNFHTDFTSALHVMVISLFVMLISNIRWSKESLFKMLFVFLASQTILSLMTILDYYGFIDLIFLNKSTDATPLLDIKNIISASGPFNSRTPFVMYLMLACIIPIHFMFTKFSKYKFYLSLIFMINLMCGFITISRGFIIVLLLTLLIYITLFYLPKIPFNKFSRLQLFFSYSFMLFLLSIAAGIFVFMSGLYHIDGQPFRLGDMKRVWANLIIYDNLLNNLIPLEIYNKPWVLDFGRIGFHNIFGFVMYKTGMIGFLIFLYIVIKTALNLININHKEITFLLGTLFITWMLYGMLHSIINITLMWIIFSLLISNAKYKEKQNENY